VVHVAARDVVAHLRVDQLDERLHAVRALLHPPGDEEHREHGQRRGDEQVEDDLVDVERPRQVQPRDRPELVDRAELLRRAVRAEDDRHHDHRERVQREEEDDFAASAHVGGTFLSSGRRIREVTR
jgi:hypothetical protein